MAACDLCAELLKDNPKIEEGNLEKAICQGLLKQLDDASVDVQGNAVKCIAKIAPKIKEKHLGEVMKKLTSCVIKGTDDFRDIYSTCLKTLISEAEESLGKDVCNHLIPALKEGLNNKSEDVREECIDILNETIKRFYSVLIGNPKLIEREVIVNTLLAQLKFPNVSLKKKSNHCLGSMAIILSSKQLGSLINKVLGVIKAGKTKKNEIFAYVQTIGSIASTVGYKMESNIKVILPIFISLCILLPDAENKDQDLDNDVAEICLNAFECFVRKCPKEITPFIDEILKLSGELISFDPNFNSEAEEVVGMEDQEDWGEWGDDMEGEMEAGDADDSSWKVRRASIKVIDSIAKCRPEMLRELYTHIIIKLIARFKERDENVKCEIFSTFSNVIRTGIIAAEDPEATELLDVPMLVRTRSSTEVLTEHVPVIVQALLEQLNSKSQKVKNSVILVYLNMAIAIPGETQKHLPLIFPELFKNYNPKQDATIKIHILAILKRMMRATMTPQLFHPFKEDIKSILLQGLNDDYFKVISEALRATSGFLKVLRPSLKEKPVEMDYHTLSDTAYSKLKATDIDHEVKQSSIYTMSILCAQMHDVLPFTEISRVMVILQERMKNEITRIPALKGVTLIINSSNKLSLEGTLKTMLPDLVNLVHKKSRGAKIHALTALLSISNHYHPVLKPGAGDLIMEVEKVTLDVDLQVAKLALQFVNSFIKSEDLTTVQVEQFIKCAITLAASPLIQGAALEELLLFFQGAAAFNKGKLSAEQLTTQLLKLGAENNLRSIAKSIAAILLSNQKYLKSCISKYINGLKDTGENTLNRKLFALTIGEIGRVENLKGYPDLQKAIFAIFASGKEDLKSYAAICLGDVAIGNMANYLPMVFEQMKTKTNQYLLLLSLREIISHNPGSLGDHFKDILPVLLENASNASESVRNIVSENLGKLFLGQPMQVDEYFSTNLRSPNHLIRSTFAASMKYCGIKTVEKMVMQEIIPVFLYGLQDKDLGVRLATLVSLNTIVHNLSPLIRSEVENIAPIIIKETDVRPELIKEIDLGPFKHKVDEGAPLRKAAYLVLDSFLYYLGEKIDSTAVLDKVRKGIGECIYI